MIGESWSDGQVKGIETKSKDVVDIFKTVPLGFLIQVRFCFYHNNNYGSFLRREYSVRDLGVVFSLSLNPSKHRLFVVSSMNPPTTDRPTHLRVLPGLHTLVGVFSISLVRPIFEYNSFISSPMFGLTT